jgi:hypothetical protein
MARPGNGLLRCRSLCRRHRCRYPVTGVPLRPSTPRLPDGPLDTALAYAVPLGKGTLPARLLPSAAMTDPTPLLSTVAGSSAAMVAIVGGLLVARFVTIASEQEGVQQLLDDGDGRLTIARNRAQGARRALYSWDVNTFFDTEVIQAISEGQRNIGALREIGSPTRLSDESLARVLDEIAAEFESARRTLSPLVGTQRPREGWPDWPDFRRSTTALPETTWPAVWETTYDTLTASPGIPGRFPPSITSFVSTAPEYVALDVQRRDALRADLEHAEQQVEDIEAEQARLQRRRNAIVRPKGLGGGLIVLGFFTVVGVIIPLWLMSRGPTRLTAHLGEVIFWLFFAGLVLLLGYMTALALRLSGWPWQGQNTTATAGQDDGSEPKAPAG